MLQLRTFDLEALDLSNDKHFVLVDRFSRDEYAKRYISKKFMEFVKEPNQELSFEVGKTYLIKKDDEFIGFLGTKDLDRNGYLEPWILIDSKIRNNKYGTKFTEELIPFLVENVDHLQDVKLVINKENLRSRKIAQNIGFTKKDNEGTLQEDTYRYFGK